jgi:adenylate kinase family enzyme
VLPVLEYYRTRPHTTVQDIDGTKDIEGVFAEIVSALSLNI